ncbi:hypothetical protein [Treponema denticola]|uniref:ATP-dependent DNA helicase RecG C-terminal domain-containing protein n=1 Tax=Treponema denticola SP33 TaxID=999437 RepID=M2BV25_TREDN|nr:hypothetical protein [Treponema denticola]EMB25919.1 hypothetical protein HMPREF9733_00519 [Treponema denticola SP33]EPF37352.1 hypothetical protein HMPREF9732_01386 [Treponema denticola SP32]
MGNAVVLNNLLVSYYKLMPYRGFGAGITRALEAQPDIDWNINTDINKYFVVCTSKKAKILKKL